MQLHSALCRLCGLCLDMCSFRRLHIPSGQDHRTVFFQLFNGLAVQHIIPNGGIIGVVLVSIRIRLGDKVQTSRLSQFLKDIIGIGRTWNIDGDPVVSLLINLSLGAVLVSTLFQLIPGITHIFRGRIIFHGLISNADTSGEIQPQVDVLHGAGACRTPAHDRRPAKQGRHKYGDDEDSDTLFLLHHVCFLFSAYSSSASAAFIIKAHSIRFCCILQPISYTSLILPVKL